MTTLILFDDECLALADHFLADEVSPASTEQRHSLAAAIQTAVEDWFTTEQISQGDGPQ